MKKELLKNKNLYSFKFAIRNFNSQFEVDGVSTSTTKPITHARCMEMIKKDLAMYKGRACYEMVRRPILKEVVK